MSVASLHKETFSVCLLYRNRRLAQAPTLWFNICASHVNELTLGKVIVVVAYVHETKILLWKGMIG